MLCQDREGIVEEFLQIQINIEKKDTDNKVYFVKTADFILRNKGTESEVLEPVKNRFGANQEKQYTRTYAEYDAQREQLLAYYQDEVDVLELVGSELDDFLLKKALMFSLDTDPIYGLAGNEWE